MTIISPRAQANNMAASSTALSSQLSQVDFLRLMTAQLRQQDPTSPADASQMVVQMAQMSSASGIAQANATLGKIADSLSAQSALLTKIADAQNQGA